MDFVHFLRDVDILIDLSADHLQKIVDISTVKTYSASDTIFEEYTTSSQLYIILQGIVEIQLEASMVGADQGQDERKTIATLRQGESFGEVALVDQGLRSASALCAQDDTRLLVVPEKEFNEVCRDDFEMGFIVMRNIAADLSFKLRQTDMGLREQIVFGKQ